MLLEGFLMSKDETMGQCEAAVYFIDTLENLETSAVVFGYVIGIVFVLLMAWTLPRQKRDTNDHSRV